MPLVPMIAEIWGDFWRYREIWRGIGRYGEIVPLVPPMIADWSRPWDQVMRAAVSRLVVVFARPARA